MSTESAQRVPASVVKGKWLSWEENLNVSWLWQNMKISLSSSLMNKKITEGRPKCLTMGVVLTLKGLSTSLQQITFFIFFYFYFSEKIRLGITCESSAYLEVKGPYAIIWNSDGQDQSIYLCCLIMALVLSVFFFCFFYLVFGFYFMALSRIFHLYRADRSSKVGENKRTQGKTTWPSVSRTWPCQMWPERGTNHSGEKANGLRVNS